MRWLIVCACVSAVGCGSSSELIGPSATVTQTVPDQTPRAETFTVDRPFCARYPGFTFCADYCRTHQCDAPR